MVNGSGTTTMPSITDFTFRGPKLDDFDFPRIGHQILAPFRALKRRLKSRGKS